MATESENLGLLLLNETQANADILVNEALQVLDALGFGLPSTVTNTPPGSPSNNDLVLVGTSPTGVFVNHENELALYLDGAWRFYTLPNFQWDTTERLYPRMRESANLYVKTINIAAGPGSSLTVDTAHGITGLDRNKPVDIQFYAYDGTTVYNGTAFIGSFDGYNVWVDGTNVKWQSLGANWTGFTGRARLIYSKT